MLVRPPFRVRPVPIVNFESQAVSGADLTTYTFTSQAIGTPRPDRTIIVAAVCFTGAMFTTLTVGGVPLVKIFEQPEGILAFHGAIVPTGSTATIVMTCTAQGIRAAISTYSVIGLTSLTPIDTAAGLTAGGDTLDVDTVSGGFVLGLARGSSTPTIAWSGLTEDHQTVIADNVDHSTASASNLSVETPRSVSTTITGGSAGSIVVSMR